MIENEEEIKSVLKEISDFVNDLFFLQDKEEIIEKLLKRITEATNCEYSSYLPLKNNPEKTVYRYRTGENNMVKSRSTERLTSGVTGRVLSEKGLVTVDEPEEISKFVPELENTEDSVIVAFPVIIRSNIEGIIYLVCNQTSIPEVFGKYSDSWTDLISTLTGLTFSNSRLYKRLERTLKNLKISFEMSRSLISAFDLDSLVDKIFSEINDRCGYERTALFIKEEDEYIVLRYTLKGFNEFLGLRLKINEEGIAGRAAGTGEPYYAPDVSADPYYYEAKKKVKSEFAIPLKIEDKLIGVLDIQSYRKNDFPESTRNLLISIGAHIAIAFEKAQLYEEMKRLSREDPLTGVLNRRKLEDAIKEEIKYGSKRGTQFSILFLDIDNFKEFNDKYGHSKGDEILIEYSQFIRNSLRSEDLFGRYGGDEFLAVLKRTDKKQAARIASRMKEDIKDKENFPDLVFSIGISEFPEDGESLTELVHSADRACYRAKKLGGDRVIIYTGEKYYNG